MPINMRLTPTDPRFFSPDRDLAYCAPHLVHRVFTGFDPENQEPWIRAYLKQNKIPLDDLTRAAEVVATYMNVTLLDPQYKEPYDALEAAGFFMLDPKVQHIVCAKLGQVFLSSIFPSIRDVTRDPSAPPFNTKHIADAAARCVERMRAYQARPRWVNWLRACGRAMLCWWSY
jgi:hypothetical protein